MAPSDSERFLDPDRANLVALEPFLNPNMSHQSPHKLGYNPKGKIPYSPCKNPFPLGKFTVASVKMHFL